MRSAALLLTALAALLAGALAITHFALQPSPPPAPAGTALPAPTVRPGVGQADPQDLDLESRRRTDRDLTRRPAFQALPVDESHLAIELLGSARDGRSVLLVTSDRPRREAHRLYTAWLRRWHDTGVAYAPLFRTYGSAERPRPARRLR